MRSAPGTICVAIGVALYGYLVAGWAPVIAKQGFEAALSDQTTQPPFLVTVGCLVIGTVFVILGATLLARRERD